MNLDTLLFFRISVRWENLKENFSALFFVVSFRVKLCRKGKCFLNISTCSIKCPSLKNSRHVSLELFQSIQNIKLNLKGENGSIILNFITCSANATR